jgi:hypothetical protein
MAQGMGDEGNNTDCNGINQAIDAAVKIHTELASAMPNVEKLFDVNSDCFSGVGKIVDLSFAIPDLAGLAAAAMNAVMEYAKKKVCSAISNVSGMVNGPINQAIGSINSMGKEVTGLFENPLASIDPNLGSAYHSSSSGSYTVEIPFKDMFTDAQTNFGGGSGGSGTSDSGSQNVADTITQPMQEFEALQSERNNIVLQEMPAAQNVMTAANNAYNNCMYQATSNCLTEQTALLNAQAKVNALAARDQELQEQMKNFTNSANGTSASVNAAAASTSSASQSEDSNADWLKSLGDLLK